MALNTYFVVVDRNNSLIELRSFPYYDDNIVMLYGHNYWVKRFFGVYGNKIKNCLKIVNSCDLIDNGSLFVGQKIYIIVNQMITVGCIVTKVMHLDCHLT